MPLALTGEMLRAVRTHETTKVEDREQEFVRIGWLMCVWDVLVQHRRDPFSKPPNLEPEFEELENKLEGWENDAMRWRWLVQHASLGFDAAPSWNAVVWLPVFDSDDQTIAALVDRARAAVGAG